MMGVSQTSIRVEPENIPDVIKEYGQQLTEDQIDEIIMRDEPFEMVFEDGTLDSKTIQIYWGDWKGNDRDFREWSEKYRRPTPSVPPRNGLRRRLMRWTRFVFDGK